MLTSWYRFKDLQKQQACIQMNENIFLKVLQFWKRDLSCTDIDDKKINKDADADRNVQVENMIWILLLVQALRIYWQLHVERTIQYEEFQCNQMRMRKISLFCFSKLQTE